MKKKKKKELEIRETFETIQTRTLLRSARILRGVLETHTSMKVHQLMIVWKRMQQISTERVQD